MFVQKFLGNVVQQAFIEIVASQLRVALATQHLDDSSLHPHDRDVERPAAKVVDDDLFRAGRFRMVNECSGRRFVDDTFDLQSLNKLTEPLLMASRCPRFAILTPQSTLALRRIPCIASVLRKSYEKLSRFPQFVGQDLDSRPDRVIGHGKGHPDALPRVIPGFVEPIEKILAGHDQDAA